MDNFDKTIRVAEDFSQAGIRGSMLVTVFDGNRQPETVRLDGFRKNPVTFGRSKGNDLVLDSPLGAWAVSI